MLPRVFAISVLLHCALAPFAVGQEFRALWVDTFHAGLRNPTETSAVIAAARAANCNAVVVEVRKRGDAYYQNGLEPVAFDVAPGFDPLADLIQKGHSGPERIEIHAWLVTYNIWNGEDTSPIQPSHPYNQHPDWLSQTDAGRQWAGSTGGSGNYLFDPAHPAVQQHTFNVCMDILNRYDIDGLHFDYIRYPEYTSSGNNQPWGYNPVAVARYKKLKNVSTTPARTDATWLQWRREQVTALVRKVYLNAWARKPNVRVSAALIPWGNPPANLNLSTWQTTEAYARVLQDWRAWMEEGILDLACPMVYRDQSITAGFGGWANFTKDRQYNRAAVIGLGWYLNTVQNTIAQIKSARAASPAGTRAVGILGYSYAVTNRYPDATEPDGYKDNKVSPATMRMALSDDATAEIYDPGGTPVFANPVVTPTMPWKTNTTKGHLIGTLREPRTGANFDGATVLLSGPSNRTLTTDGTGFFGSADLPIGNYTLRVSIPGYRPLTQAFSVTGATVAQPALQLEMVPLQIISVSRSIVANTLTVTWNSIPGRTYRVEGSSNLQTWSTITSGLTATGTTMAHQWTLPPAWQGQAFVRVVEEP